MTKPAAQAGFAGAVAACFGCGGAAGFGEGDGRPAAAALRISSIDLTGTGAGLPVEAAGGAGFPAGSGASLGGGASLAGAGWAAAARCGGVSRDATGSCGDGGSRTGEAGFAGLRRDALASLALDAGARRPRLRLSRPVRTGAAGDPGREKLARGR